MRGVGGGELMIPVVFKMVAEVSRLSIRGRSVESVG